MDTFVRLQEGAVAALNQTLLTPSGREDAVAAEEVPEPAVEVVPAPRPRHAPWREEVVVHPDGVVPGHPWDVLLPDGAIGVPERAVSGNRAHIGLVSAGIKIGKLLYVFFPPLENIGIE